MLRVLIGSLDCLFLLRLGIVITLVLIFIITLNTALTEYEHLPNTDTPITDMPNQCRQIFVVVTLKGDKLYYPLVEIYPVDSTTDLLST